MVADPQTTDIGLLELPPPAPGSSPGPSRFRRTSRARSSWPRTGTGFSALADRNGDYAIFNLAPGSYSVTAYARGAVHEEKSATVLADAVTDVDLGMTSAGAATVSGNVSLVNRGAGTGTSVILVVESFDPVFLRGETPPGLRAPGLASRRI